MRLQQFSVHKFRNIVDSGAINVQSDVTCLVGMNEAGKSAILTALARLNPARTVGFSVSDDYPRWLKTADTRADTIKDVSPIQATFAVEASDRARVEAAFGEGVLTSDTVTLSRRYDDTTLYYSLAVDVSRALTNLVHKHAIPSAAGATFTGLRDLADLDRAARAARAAHAADAAAAAALDRLIANLETLDSARGVRQRLYTLLRPPTFFYFSDYSTLDGRIDLDHLARAEAEQTGSSSDQTARSLLALANTTAQALSEEDYEERKAELEAVSNDLTEQVFSYCKQNDHLRVTFDLDRRIEKDPHGRPHVVRNVLDVRVQDTRHNFTNNFSQRSSGFRWFFSFLAAFTEFELRTDRFVVLLDEPALTLHGRAQSDFLRFVNERLASASQVLYTTHSPFMVESDHLDRVRIVEDQGPKKGAVVTQEALSVREDSLFSLQAALGYDIAQHLFIGDANLLVEGPSDLLYLDLIGRRLADNGGVGLHRDWRILPAGGAGNVPAFVALLGSKVAVTVLIDSGTEGTGRLDRAIEAGRLPPERLVSVQEITKNKNSDIEDLFSEADYLRLYNAAFGTAHTPANLPPGERIVQRLASLDGRFDHYKPADRLLRDSTLLDSLQQDTFDNFSKLIRRINKTR